MKQYIIKIGIGVVIIAGVFYFVASDRTDDGANTSQGDSERTSQSDFDRLATITLFDYAGNNVSLSEFEGKPLVINSWAVWCPFCRKELADFAELQQEFGDQIVVIAIDRRESLEKAKGYTDELGITDDLLFFLDPSDAFYKKIGGFSMPETIFMDEDGNIIVHKRGVMELDEMREHTRKIVQ